MLDDGEIEALSETLTLRDGEIEADSEIDALSLLEGDVLAD